jgi:hypothetical protein|tara:strand:+ start:4597 stop:5529 length:933 start_codon:yes stop_codon:yes gene_type:complete
MQSKVIFFSESNIKGKVPRDFENARTEFGWSIMLDAEWCPLNDIPKVLDYDLGIVIIPKNNPQVDLDFFKEFCKNVAVMQEGPHWYYQDYPVDKQIHYINCLREADWVYCHNESDKKYYYGLGCKDVRVMRSMMVPEGLDSQITTSQKNGILLGGNFVSWYGGMDSYLVASEVNEQKYGVSMGRKQEQEEMIEDIKYLPYMSWREWINHIGQYKVGVHLMRTHAAGTFSMNMSWHGTPVIGYSGLDTQELLHPQTTVEVGDLVKARQIMKKLYEDEFFYQECSEQTKGLFNKHYSEEAWLKHWRKQNETI